MEALNKAYAGKGISFYYVLSREPHPGFYGFSQTDSLEMRQEYVRLANAELSIALPWIIDDMDNTMQKTYGGMPNSEFIVGSDGKLIESRDWANTDKLKEWLEANLGPSGISEEEWEELGARDQTAMAVGNNDEVPATQVPTEALHTLDIKRLDGGDAIPITFEAATLPPNVTADGQSRLYFVISPRTGQGISFDTSAVITVDFSEVKGIKFIKDQLQSGKRRSRVEEDKDIYPHTLGVLWSLDEGRAARMAFRAAVTAQLEMGAETSKTVKALYQVEGPVPQPKVIADEITAEMLPSGLQNVQVEGTGSSIVPMDVRAKLDASKGMLYIILDVHEDTGHHWNNLSPPPTVALKTVSGAVVEKTSLLATKHDGDGDTESRILAVSVTFVPGAAGFVIEATPEAWICHDDEGWCRIFSKTFKITGKL